MYIDAPLRDAITPSLPAQRPADHGCQADWFPGKLRAWRGLHGRLARLRRAQSL